MGRRRDKVKWSQVDLLEGKISPIQNEPHSEAQPIKNPSEPSRNSCRPQHRRASAVPPRFAKNLSRSEATIKEADCSVEELPDGYIKIRSKNLDIIFKKEFYHKRMMELQVRGITPNTKSQVKEEWNEANVSKSSSINIPDASVDQASVTVDSMPSFIDLDLDEIPEFRPRAGTDVGSVNDSGYSSSFQESFCYDRSLYPPQPQYLHPQGPVFHPQPPHLPPPLPLQPMCPFYLFSAATNTLIPCEEVLVSQTLDTPGGPIFQGHTKAYVAYPVQGPDGRGYIMQPFAPPPELSSSPEREKMDGTVVKEDADGESVKESLKPSKPSQSEERARKVDHVILPNVYIPGLPPSELRVKKKRKKKPKAKSDQVPVPRSSSDSDDFEPVNYQHEELFEFTTEEPMNEINLTDDLTNSLLNPPTEDDEIESSALAREILNLVDTDEDTRPSEILPCLEAKKPVEEPKLANAEVEVVIEPTSTEENLVNPKPVSTKPHAKQKKKKTKKKVETQTPQIKASLPVQLDLSSSVVVNNEEDQSIADNGFDPEVTTDAFPVEETEPYLETITSDINETEVRSQEAVKTTDKEGSDCMVSRSNDILEPSPPPNVPAVQNRIKDGKGKRRKKRSHKEGNDKEKPLQKVLVMDNQVSGFHGPYLASAPNPDMILVKEIGFGMRQGVMELGRLFQGHYVPPARSEYAIKEECVTGEPVIEPLEVE